MLEIPGTLEDHINIIKNVDLSYRNLHDTATLHNNENNSFIEVPYLSITNKYRHFLKSIVTDLDLTEEQREEYKFQPKKVSDDIYDTTEFWNDILQLNNVYSIIDFIPGKSIKIYDPNELKSFLSEVLNFHSNTYE